MLSLLCVPALGAQRTAASLERFTVSADGHPMAIWARAPLQPTRTILLVHGATWSARPDFDLQVPGEERSVLAALAARGYAAYAIDLRGYGATPRDRSGWLTPNRAAADVAITLTWIARRHPDLPRPALLGWSNGALVAQLVAQQKPALLSDLVLYGSPWTSGVIVADDEPSSPTAPHVPNDNGSAASDFITPGSISRRAVDAYVATALRSDPVRAEWRHQVEWNALDAARVRTPTLVIFGELDPLAADDAQRRTFLRLKTSDKALVELKGGDHAALLEHTSPDFVSAVATFLERPVRPRGPNQPRS
jgi:alpha-beta hydrolase superfamily lysophospholipase